MNQQILVIDDSEEIHKLIKAILANEPVDIQSATNPNYGLILAASVVPDLILLDVEMPEKDGFEVCRRLKADSLTMNCPIMFLTSHAQTKEKVRGLGLGAMDYLTKPFNASELVARVRSMLRTNRVIRSLQAQALIDPLTGLGNRAMFVRRAASEIRLRARSGNPLSITVFQIDQFERVQSIYSRAVIDQVIESIGKILLLSYRMEDIACHFGDGVFGVIAPNTTGKESAVFAQRVREAVACKTIEPQGDSLSVVERQCFSVTVSVGIANAEGLYDQSMIERAEIALESARTAGGNCVRIADERLKAQSAAA